MYGRLYSAEIALCIHERQSDGRDARRNERYITHGLSCPSKQNTHVAADKDAEALDSQSGITSMNDHELLIRD